MAKTERELIKAEPLKVSTLSNGLTIASLENYSPVTTIGVAIKAGARNEGYDNEGVTHALRVASGMATTKNTAFGMCRNLQQVSYHIPYTIPIQSDLNVSALVIKENWKVEKLEADFGTKLKVEQSKIHSMHNSRQSK